MVTVAACLMLASLCIGPALEMMKVCVNITGEMIDMVKTSVANKARCKRLAHRCFNIVEEIKK
jgi:hypothetical protein